MVVQGFDISNHQGNISWDALMTAGAEFIFIKATQGVGYKDPFFFRNWAEAKSRNVVRGAYHFAEAENGTNPKTEADRFLDYITMKEDLTPGKELVILDLEPPAGSVALDKLAVWTLTWMQYVHETSGIRPMLYTGVYVSDYTHPLWAGIEQYPLWLANYRSTVPAAPKPWSEISVWQNSGTYRIPEYGGDLDHDFYLGTVPITDFVAQLGGVVPGDTFWEFAPEGSVGDGLVTMMRNDKTRPGGPSTFLPLGSTPSQWEECTAVDGWRYVWHLSTGKSYRYAPATRP